MEALGSSLKRCAAAAGLSEGSVLSAYISRHVLQRPQALLAAGGFVELLARWRGLLQLA